MAKSPEQLKIEWFESALTRIQRECSKPFSDPLVLQSVKEIVENTLARKDQGIRV